MTSVAEFIAALERDGIRLRLDGKELRFTAKKGALTDALKAEIARRKGEIVAHLFESVEAADVPRPCPREGGVPLSYAQERIFFLSELDASKTAYSVPVVLSIQGPFLKDAFERAIGDLIARNETLRTVVRKTDDGPRQFVLPAESFGLAVQDISGLSEDSRKERVTLAARDLLRTPFDLARGPVFSARLFALGKDSHAAIFRTHLLATDGWSLEMLLDELAGLYAAHARGRKPDFAEKALHYADYAHWQRRHGDESRWDDDVLFWKKTLESAPIETPLPFDRPRTSSRFSKAGQVVAEIDESTIRRLRDVGKSCGTTLFAVVKTAFDLTLMRMSGIFDIVVATVVSNRNRAEWEKMTGTFGNTVLLRAKIDTTRPVTEIVRSVHAAALDAMAHQEVPFEHVVERLGAAGKRTPDVRVLFVYHPRPLVLPELWPGLTVKSEHVAPETTSLDWDLSFYEGERSTAVFGYSADLFDRGTIDRVVATMRTILEGIAENPNRSVEDICRGIERPSPVARENPRVTTLRPPPPKKEEIVGETAKAVAEIWSGLLPDARVRLYDNFFDIGGNSLTVIRAISSIEERFGIRLDVGDMMMQTLGQVAATVEARVKEAKDAPPKKRGGFFSRIADAVKRKQD